MGKFWLFVIFLFVSAWHLYILNTHIKKETVVSKPSANVHHITLSKVVVKKQQPIPPKPIIEPKPIVKPIIKPKPKKKPKKKKRVKKPKIVEPELVVEEIIEPTPEPIVEQVVAPVAVVDTSSIKDQYTSEIRRQIKSKLVYPKMAKRLRMEDTVQVGFMVASNGDISNIRVLNSPKKLLAKGAIKTIKSLDLAPIPAELNEQFMDITIPVEYNLIR